MSTVFSESPSVDEQAMYWFALRKQILSTEQQQAFTQWLEQSQTHVQAYADLETIWQDFSFLERPVLDTTVDIIAPPINPVHSFKRYLRYGLAAAVVCVFSVLGIQQGLFNFNPDINVQTQASLQSLSLADGSSITLNMHTQFYTDFSSQQRDVYLTHGEAFFDVAKDSQRPFVIHTPQQTVKVVGTKFNVAADSQRLVVAVEQGRVELRNAEQNEPSAILSAGQLARFDGQTLTVQNTVDTDEVGSWRTGLLVFHNKPLDELVSDLSRYTGQDIQLADAALHQLKISGSLDIYQADSFLQALPLLAPVELKQTVGRVQISAKNALN